jgi:hypothetical protein
LFTIGLKVMRAFYFLAIEGRLLGVHKCETSDLLPGAPVYNGES